MTHDELLAKINDSTDGLKHDDIFPLLIANTQALRAVLELHKPEEYGGPARCPVDGSHSPCSTIQAIEKELK
jgi:hypothetical protein